MAVDFVFLFEGGQSFIVGGPYRHRSIQVPWVSVEDLSDEKGWAGGVGLVLFYESLKRCMIDDTRSEISSRVEDCLETAMKEFRTDCRVDAPIQICYEVLTDFENYGEWSASHVRVERKQQRLKLHLRPSSPSKRPLVLPAEVRVEESPTHLAWGGGVKFAPWILDIHHFFELEEQGEQTHFVHGERFSGIVGHPLASIRSAQLLEQYQRFNASFAQRCAEIKARSR